MWIRLEGASLSTLIFLVDQFLSTSHCHFLNQQWQQGVWKMLSSNCLKLGGGPVELIYCTSKFFIHWLFETSLHKTQGQELGFWCVVLSESSAFVCKYLQSIVIRHRAPDQRQCKVLFDFSQQNPLSYVSLVHEDLPFRIKQISVLLFANINK